MWSEYIEQRKKQRAKEEEELRKLKERQVKRKAQRADQEKQMLELKKRQEEQKQREIVSLLFQLISTRNAKLLSANSFQLFETYRKRRRLKMPRRSVNAWRRPRRSVKPCWTP